MLKKNVTIELKLFYYCNIVRDEHAKVGQWLDKSYGTNRYFHGKTDEIRDT